MKFATMTRNNATGTLGRARAAKERTDIAALIGRDVPLRRRGRDNWGRCPFHVEKTPSFRVDPARQNFRCFGCGAHGDVIDFLMATADIDFGAAVEMLEIEAGIRPDSQGRRTRQTPRPCPSPGGVPDQDEMARAAAARAIWAASGPIGGSTAERYLEGRGLIGPWAPSLRFHPNLKHATTGLYFPAMVAAVAAADGKLTGIQRTYLRPDGRDKAQVKPQRMDLGPKSRGAVRLAPATDRVWLCEGTEDALSVAQLFQEPAWAVLGTGEFGNVDLPEAIKTVILAPDRDDAGQAVIDHAAARLAGQGREVRIARPQTGKDWNEALAGAEERAGIMEFDGEVARQDASRTVAREVLRGQS